MARVELPRGLWLGICLPSGTTEDELVQLFLDRTGVMIEPGCISVGDKLGGSDGKVQCVISFRDQTLTNIMQWITSEDTIGGEKLRWSAPLRQRK